MGSPSQSNAAARKKPSPGALGSLHIKEFAVRQLVGRLDRVKVEWNRCADSPGADEIHDLRVSLRRFGETLWLFRRLFPKRERKQVRAELKTVLGFAGNARDVDIAFESFEEAGILLSPELRLNLESERAIAEAALVASLAVGRRTNVTERWRRALGLQPVLAGTASHAFEDPHHKHAAPEVKSRPLSGSVVADEIAPAESKVTEDDAREVDDSEAEVPGSDGQDDHPLQIAAAIGPRDLK
jgi:CHAD domain-containing protein